METRTRFYLRIDSLEGGSFLHPAPLTIKTLKDARRWKEFWAPRNRDHKILGIVRQVTKVSTREYKYAP